MTLLFITQKLHEQDAFGILWIREFIKQGYTVKVLCLENRAGDLAFDVYSMGKEKGYGRVRQILRFWRYIFTLEYDRVFIHMSPVWGLFGSLLWILRRTPVYLWYTHYKLSVSMRVTGWYAKRLFCATPQSLPHYNDSKKKVVVGHGIDLSYWPQRENTALSSFHLLMVHRLSRSKRVELALRALVILPQAYTLDIYGIEAEKDYVSELKKLVTELGLDDRVIFHGTVPMEELADIYTQHRLILNMASETIDKTMLEAMTCGCYPVTTQANAQAIGITEAPGEDTPEAIALFVENNTDRVPLSSDDMYGIVRSRHSLEGLVSRMSSSITDGC